MAVTFSYSGNPSASNLDAVRFLIGDTNPNDPQLGDEEIAFLITSEGTALEASICAALAIAAKYSRKVDTSDDKTARSYGDLAQHYRDLANDLRLKRGRKPVAAYAGGIDVADKEANAGDTSVDQPTFRRGLHDNRMTNPVTGE